MTDEKEISKKQLIENMPDEVKQVILTLTETAITRWEDMSQESRDRFDSIENYLGANILEMALCILAYSEDDLQKERM